MSGGLQTSRGGQGPGGITNVVANIPNVVTKVSLTQPSNVITIINYSSSTGNNVTLAVDFNGGTPVIGVGNGIDIPPGASFEYDGVALSSFTLIGSAASDTYAVVAH